MALINRLDSRDPGFKSALSKLLAFEATEDESIDRAAAGILADVRTRGDAALVEYTQRFDRMPGASAATLEIPKADWHAALATLPAAQRNALEAAADRVRSYHERQRAETWTYTDAEGTMLGQQVTPLDRVGLYVPGGKAAYPSSVLMNAIPAKVAGVPELIMVTPTPDGVRNPIVLAAAAIGGVDRVFAIGGAQAVGALAYGTSTVPAVDKIVGPGNAYVAAAKRRVFGTVGIDMIAGPSEILIICDGKTPADWIAMDLFSQAEHDELAQSIPALSRRRVHRGSRSRHRAPPAHDAARRHPARQPGQPRRADPGPEPGRGLPDRQRHRARALGNLHRTARDLDCQDPPRRRDLHGPLQLGSAGRLLRGPEPRAAHVPHGALFVAAGRV